MRSRSPLIQYVNLIHQHLEQSKNPLNTPEVSGFKQRHISNPDFAQKAKVVEAAFVALHKVQPSEEIRDKPGSEVPQSPSQCSDV